MSRKTKAILSVGTILIVLILDQALKIWVKTHMHLYESIDVTDWFKIRFIQNNGMAFGWEIGGKYLLTSFRIVAVTLIGWYLVRQIRAHRPLGLILCLSLVLAGAAGNIFDCLFYGQIFNNPPAFQVAEFVPWGQGYSGLMLGEVVDMLYFPLVEWDMPATWTWLDSVPLLPDAGEHCIFFSPIFNIADAAISCAMILLIILSPRYFNQKDIV